jgi:peptidoglycan/xylan/chitin deacetylase (PgdA/CDA1 family)
VDSTVTTLRTCALYICRAIGLFGLARHLTRRQLRILCYHGFSLGDEHEISPVMFLRGATFEQRMQILAKRRIPVITLDEAVRRLSNGGINNAETVITLDDGWASNLSVAAPILAKHGYPACVYISTEHLTAGTEVFNVALYYMICRSGRRRLTLAGLHPQIDGDYDIGTNAQATTGELIERAERALPLADRQKLLRPIAQALGLELDEVLRDGRFRLLSRAEIREAFRRGLDIQLHTHTHRLPADDFGAMAEELEQNRTMIEELTGVRPRHFCYPSGEYSEQQPEWLTRLGIVSATTCDRGLNDARTPVMLLKRFLDSDSKRSIAFEAEICGVRELLRHLSPAAMLREWSRSPSHARPSPPKQP